MYKYVEFTKKSFVKMLTEYESSEGFNFDERFSDEVKELIYDYLNMVNMNLVIISDTLWEIYSTISVYNDIDDYNAKRKAEFHDTGEIANSYVGFMRMPNSNGFFTVSEQIDGDIYCK